MGRRRFAVAPPATFPGLPPHVRFGMSAPSNVWDQRAGEVGAGVTARRIFAQFTSTGADQADVIEQALTDGMLPVISYKGSNVKYARKTADWLETLDEPVAVVYHHEPFPDMVGARYAATVKTLMPLFQRANISRGCFLNGWLLDTPKRQAILDTYCPDDVLAGGYWDWFGIDTYQAGTIDEPGRPWPGDRVAELAAYTEARGYGTIRLAIGEYNGFTADAIADAGAKILAEPRVWLACMWNSTSGKGYALSGDRLAAFQQTLTDEHVA